MRALQYKRSELVVGGSYWSPIEIEIGSRLHGKRFQKGSVFFEPSEIEKALEEPEKFKRWLQHLSTVYYETSSNS